MYDESRPRVRPDAVNSGEEVLVSGALLYAVVKTVDTSAALFTGG
jgi:hypothetical protein